MQEVYTEKEVLGDGLSAAKMATNNYNTASNECAHKKVRDTLLHLLEQEHAIQQDVFNLMHEKGFYPTPMAQENKITEAKQKFAKCVK